METREYELREMFIVIKLIKIAQIRHGTKYAQKLFPASHDDLMEIFITLMEDMEEKVRSEYYEDCGDGINLYRYETREMTEYFRLAHKFGEIYGFSKDENPYIKSAFVCLKETVGDIDSYCYGYRLYHSKTRKTRLYFMFDAEYWMPLQTIEELYNFFDYFPKKLRELRREFRKTKKLERRKAA